MPITSTSSLTPAGILGYAKGLAVTIGSILIVVAEQLPADLSWKRWLQLGILICTIIGTIAVPNTFRPVTVAAETAGDPGA